jgi:RHS repeat-associated protein
MQTTSNTYQNNSFRAYLTLKNSSEKARINYIYGFQGQEKDDEVKGEGNSYDFGARMHDPRIARWLTQDAMSMKKPDLSPYQGFKNNPVVYVDPDGNDEYLSIIIKDESGHQTILRGTKPISKKYMAGYIAYSGETRVFPTQTMHDFRTIITVTRNADGTMTVSDPVYYRLPNGNSIQETLQLGWFGSGYNRGEIVDYTPSDWSLEGSGGSQAGGYRLVSKDGAGASPTKQKSLSPAQEVEVGELLETLGALKNGSLGNADADQIKDFVDLVQGYDEVLQEYELGPYKPKESLSTEEYVCPTCSGTYSDTTDHDKERAPLSGGWKPVEKKKE